MSLFNHEEARRYLHFHPHEFGAVEHTALAEHLTTCAECRTYAATLAQLRPLLSRAMQARWDASPLPADGSARDRTRFRQSRPGQARARRVAVLAGAGVLVVVAVIAIAWLWRPALTPASPTADTRQAIHVLGVHHIQPGESVQCIATAYGIAPKVLAEVNHLGEPPQLRSGPLLIPDAPGEATPLGRTCTPQFPSPYALDPAATVAAPLLPVFELKNGATSAHAHPAGCEAIGIVGQAYARDGAPLAGLIIRLEKNGLSQEARTGDALEYGAGGYAFQLDQRRHTTLGVYQLQLLNTNRQPLSDVISLNTNDECDQNLLVVNFVQR